MLFVFTPYSLTFSSAQLLDINLGKLLNLVDFVDGFKWLNCIQIYKAKEKLHSLVAWTLKGRYYCTNSAISLHIFNYAFEYRLIFKICLTGRLNRCGPNHSGSGKVITVHFQGGCPPPPYVQTIIGCGMSSVANISQIFILFLSSTFLTLC